MPLRSGDGRDHLLSRVASSVQKDRSFTVSDVTGMEDAEGLLPIVSTASLTENRKTLFPPLLRLICPLHAYVSARDRPSIQRGMRCKLLSRSLKEAV